MMFDIGWTELVIIGVVALIVIGPRDLPEMFRTLGRITAKLRSMAREFQRAMESAADESGMKDVAKDLKTVANPKSLGIDAVKEAASKFEKWDPLKNAARPTPPSSPAAVATPAVAATSATAAAEAAPRTAPDAAAPDAAAPDAAALGPNTRALAEQVEARRAAAQERAAELRAARGEGAAPGSATTADKTEPQA